MAQKLLLRPLFSLFFCWLIYLYSARCPFSQQWHLTGLSEVKESSNTWFADRGHYQSQQKMQRGCYIMKVSSPWPKSSPFQYDSPASPPHTFVYCLYMSPTLPRSIPPPPPPDEASLVCEAPSLVSTFFKWLFTFNHNDMRNPYSLHKMLSSVSGTPIVRLVKIQNAHGKNANIMQFSPLCFSVQSEWTAHAPLHSVTSHILFKWISCETFPSNSRNSLSWYQ